jgi:hypothetical protein
MQKAQNISPPSINIHSKNAYIINSMGQILLEKIILTKLVSTFYGI